MRRGIKSVKEARKRNYLTSFLIYFSAFAFWIVIMPDHWHRFLFVLAVGSILLLMMFIIIERITHYTIAYICKISKRANKFFRYIGY